MNSTETLTIETLGIIAGNGMYPQLLVEGARKAGVKHIAVAAFENETRPELAGMVDEIEWLRVGQLGKLTQFFKKRQIAHAIMAGQIAPKNLFDLRPDMRALVILATLKERNAESIFTAIGNELANVGTTLLNATMFMEEHLAQNGLIAGPALKRALSDDVEYGLRIAREVSRLDIGQTVVVKRGTVLAVEGFDGTNATIERGGRLGKKDAVVAKVAKPGQDFRFDVPVIGPQTLETAVAAGITAIAVEAGRTLVLERARVIEIARQTGISVVGG